MSCDESVFDFVWLDIRYKPVTRAGLCLGRFPLFHTFFFLLYMTFNILHSAREAYRAPAIDQADI
jgi:hypothetical protein